MTSAKWLDFLVFSDEDKKLYVLSNSTFTDLFLWDVKEPTSLFERVVVADFTGLANLYGMWDWVGMAPCM